MVAEEVLDALVAGAAAGGNEVATAAAKAAVTGAYTTLKDLVSRRFTDRTAAQTALAEVETQAEQKGEGQVEAVARSALNKELAQAGIEDDEQVKKAAQALLTALTDAGLRDRPAGRHYAVDARGAYGPVIGDGNEVTQHFGGSDAPSAT